MSLSQIPLSRVFILFSMLWLLSVPLQGVAAVPTDERTLLERKQALIGTMLRPGPTVKKISDSGNSLAKEKLKQARKLHQQAELLIAAGDLAKAKQSSNQALLTITSALSLARKGAGPSAADKKRYQVLSSGLASLEKNIQADPGVSINQGQLSRLKLQAARAQKSNDYRKANNLLVQAYEMAVAAVSSANQKKTVVVSLDFDTPKDEYEYEAKRYQGNRELVETVLKRQQPTSTHKLVRQGMGRADKTRNKAKQQASNGDYSQAISTMEQASEQLSKMMAMLGIRF